MNINMIAEKVEHIANSWEQYVANNKSNNKIQELEMKISNIQTAMERPEMDFRDVEHKTRFSNYLRRGETNGLETKALSSTNNGDGGYLITTALQNKIVSGMLAKSPMRRLVSVETISTNSLDIIIQDGEFDSGWVAEAVARGDSATPKLQQKRITVHELFAQPKATQRLLDDSAINLEDWLDERLQDSFLRSENRSFIMGDGNNQPTGILHYDNSVIEHVAASKTGEIKPEDILKLINTLSEGYLANATMLMHRSTLSEIQKLKDCNGRFIWQPALSEAVPETLFGIPVVCASDMPTFASGSPVVAIADFKAAYKIVDRSGIAIMRDPYTDKPFVKFYAVKRVGGDVVDAKAIKILKI